MGKERIATDGAPAAIGPYSQGIAAGGFVYTAGQLPMNPTTGAVETDDVKQQAEIAIGNVKAILEAAGSGLDKVVKVTIFVTDMADFGAINEVYSRFFDGQGELPARAVVQAAALPKPEAKLEIEAVALK